MTVVDLVRLFAEPLGTAVVLTDTDLERPGPTILYANPAFERMSGYSAEEVCGNSPRMLQGPATNRQLTRLVARRLRAERRFHGVLENYRKSGEGYLCEVDVRPIFGRDEEPIGFLAFEREVVRRIGRPGQGAGGRYRPIAVEGFETGAFCTAPTPFC
ncbi:PAS domain S-box protein [Methylorubrum sp. SB2]|uniref:PAS domain-containing protein n=1 Tax=Methylorubrum subtropicum TaxID=3138812 RepID=UPI00313EB1C9